MEVDTDIEFENQFDDGTHIPEEHLSVFEVIENFGWYILAFSLLAVYVYMKYIKPEMAKYFQRKSDAEYHKNPDVFQAKVLAMEQSRFEMQEKYRLEAEKYQQMVEERENRKRQQRLDRASNVATGNKLGNSSESKSGLKTEYNPLMGGGTSGGYRPPKKGCCDKKCG